MDEEREKANTPPLIVPPGWLRPKTLGQWFSEPSPQHKWLVRGALPREALCMMSGPRKRAFKTYTAMFFAVMAAYGLTYEHFPTWACDEAVNVLFLEQESTSEDNRRRVQNIMRGLKLGEPEEALKKAKAEFLWGFRSMFKLDNPAMVGELIKFMRSAKTGLLVLDALTYMHRGEANSERDMGVVALALADIRAATGATILWLSHTNKEGESLDRDPDLDVRGSSILLDIYDAHVAIRRKKKRKLTTLFRFKEAPERELDIYWNLPAEPPDGSPAIGPAWPEVVTVTGEKRGDEVLARLLEAGWKPGAVYSVKAFQNALGMTPGATAELRSKLIAAGKLKAGPDGSGVGLP